MDKKYLTSRLFLISGIGLIICGIIMFCYPFLLQELDQPLFKIIFCTLGLVSFGGAYAFFNAFCFYPVFAKEDIIMCNAVIPSRARRIKYGEINYAIVSQRETGKGYIVLQIQFGLKDGEDFGYTIMTDVKQLEELRYELKSHGVTEDPVSDAIVKRVGDKVYRSNGIVALFLGLILFWAAVCVAMGVFMHEDQTALLVVGDVMLGCTIAIIWVSNYVCVEHNRLIVKNLLPFFSKVIYFSDIEKADIDQKYLLTVTFKSGDKKVKRILGLLSPSLVEALKVRLKIEIYL